MDAKVGSALKKQILKPNWPDDQVRKVSVAMNSPEMETHRRELRQLVTSFVLRQVHDCEWAQVEVVRQENNVTLKWAFKMSAGTPEKYTVIANAWEILLVPNFERADGGLIVSTRGNGSIHLELEEGVAYVFEFLFADRDKYYASDVEIMPQCILFQVAIPLSDERKALLRKAVGLDLHPEERVRHKMETYLDKQDAFDEVSKQAIERIKAKGLSPDEERERIEDFNDYAKSVKDQLGM